MVLILVLIIVALTSLILISLFAPHRLPWYRPSLVLDRDSDLAPINVEPLARQPIIIEGLAEPENDFSVSGEEKIAKLESIIEEKNRLIKKLQRELAAYRCSREEFEKIKSILDEEIQHLKDQNKELKSKVNESLTTPTNPVC